MGCLAVVFESDGPRIRQSERLWRQVVVVCALLFCITTGSGSAYGQACRFPQTDPEGCEKTALFAKKYALAMRFRPYVKTSISGGTLETRRPATWQWIVMRSTMVSGYKSNVCTGIAGDAGSLGTENDWPDGTPVSGPPDLVAHPELIISFSSADLRNFMSTSSTTAPAYSNPRYALHLNHNDYYDGEDWSDAVNGDGLYAHVEQVVAQPTLIWNIEYTMLWAENDASCDHHDGDITSIVLTYDEHADMLTRITFSMHGRMLETYRLAQPETTSLQTLDATDQTHAFKTVVAELSMGDSDTSNSRTGVGETKYSDSHIFLFRDPQTMRFDHPAVFFEYGSHEPWPNGSGDFIDVPAHDGDGMSYLPANVQMLGFDGPPQNFPFVFYNGLFGTDGIGIALHNTWYWPNGRIPGASYTDPDPYDLKSGLGWPPHPEFATDAAITVTVDHIDTTTIATSGLPLTGSPSAPFPDPMAANSLAPPGAAVQLAPGVYPVTGSLSRRGKFTAPGGAAIIGKK